MVLRFLLRYVLMGLAAYVIFTVSPASLYGFFAGLFLPVRPLRAKPPTRLYMALSTRILALAELNVRN